MLGLLRSPAEGSPPAEGSRPAEAGPARISPSPSRARRCGRLLARCFASAGSGALLLLGFPPYDLWFFAPLGIAVLVAVLRGRSARAGFGYGYLAGLGLFVPLLPWVGVFVGSLPWLALAAAEALAVGLFGAMAAVVSRLPGGPLWIACAWVATEALRSRVPFGGFPWGRLAFGQADGPLLPLASLAGAPGLSFAVALTGCLLAAAAGLVWRGRHVRAVGMVAASLIPLLVALALPWSSAAMSAGSPDRQATVAIVQGNVPRAGLGFYAQRDAVLANHVDETLRLAADVAAGLRPRPRLVIWPENAADIDPLQNPGVAAKLDRAARAVGAPILVGTLLDDPDGTQRNVAMVWSPATGPGRTDVKRQLVPFGEYLPMRSLVTKISPMANLAGHMIPGHGDGVVRVAGVPVAVAICYEVAFGRLTNQSMQAGAQLLAVPSNNATFGHTDMTYQQLAISQVRAVQYHRSVLVAATSGVSAIVSPEGRLQQQTGMFVPAMLVGQVPLETDTTLATRLGNDPEFGITAAALLALLVGLTLGSISSHRRRSDSAARV